MTGNGDDMDIAKILEELRPEREQMDEVIANLERLGPSKRRGRPQRPWPNNPPPDPPLPPGAAVRVPRPPTRPSGLVWAVAGRKRLA
jgi:hypothetical protein